MSSVEYIFLFCEYIENVKSYRNKNYVLKKNISNIDIIKLKIDFNIIELQIQ